MRLVSFLSCCFAVTFFMQACQSLDSSRSLKTEVEDYSLSYLRTTELLRLQKKYTSLTEDYRTTQSSKKVSANRKQLGTLEGEVARKHIKRLKKIEKELATRYLQGDKEAHFTGIETYTKSMGIIYSES
ncbi:MAG: hypothetical protein AAGA18_06100 [Verrucomicrobiota bacterium]